MYDELEKSIRDGAVRGGGRLKQNILCMRVLQWWRFAKLTS